MLAPSPYILVANLRVRNINDARMAARASASLTLGHMLNRSYSSRTFSNNTTTYIVSTSSRTFVLVYL